MVDTVPWNKEKLYQLVRTKLGNKLLVVVSNREPYVHTMSGDRIKWDHPVSGLTEALDPVLRASGGIWIAHGAGDADRKTVDASNRIAVPPDSPEYTLRRVWLTKEEVAGHYRGFSNGALWPLCHIAFTPPLFDEVDWQTYKKVNRIFADAVMQEIGRRRAVVLLQDYHFALLSRYLKEHHAYREGRLTIGQFWHIPWPPYEVFRTCPWSEEIVDGMLGNDLLGFHISSFCNNFLETASRVLDIKIDHNKSKVIYRGNTTTVEPFPISVDFEGISGQVGTEAVEREMERLRRKVNLEGKYLGVGMDRLDYTKGIPERLLALDKFLEDNPEYRGKVVFIQAGMPSRSDIETYRGLRRRIDNLMKSINKKYRTDSWRPIIPMTGQLSYQTLNALRRLARFCVVSSLHDGMNLVAKEYVSARIDGDGVLILSRFTGAAVELPDALLINPNAIGEFAGKIKEAIEMPEAERRRRMANMRRIVAANNIYRWGASIFSRLISMAGGR